MRDDMVPINGQRLHVTDTEGSLPVLLFAHGNQMDVTMWSDVIDLLADKYRCIAWDTRLHGSSAGDELPFTYWDAARDALAILDWAQVPRAILVGHSQGGFTALRAALLAPQRVAGLALVDTMAHAFSGESLGQMAAARDALAAGEVDGVAAGLLQMAIGDADIEDAWKARMLRQSASRLARALGVLMGADDISDRIADISTPAVVIHGELDQPIPFALGEELAQTLPSAYLVPIADNGHTPSLTAPRAVADAIAAFARSVP
jgi:3-oxoadipate enol-lactonase